MLAHACAPQPCSRVQVATHYRQIAYNHSRLVQDPATQDCMTVASMPRTQARQVRTRVLNSLITSCPPPPAAAAALYRLIGEKKLTVE